MEKYPYQDITEKIIRCCYNVYDVLGSGFLESVYEKSLIKELEDHGIKCESQKSINVYFKDTLVGEFRADLIVEGKILVEIKSISTLQKIHEAQLINYLKATKIKIGLLINFGEKLEFKRRIN